MYIYTIYSIFVHIDSGGSGEISDGSSGAAQNGLRGNMRPSHPGRKIVPGAANRPGHLGHTIFSGRTASSNSAGDSSPRDTTASFREMPSWRAFLAHLAAAS